MQINDVEESLTMEEILKTIRITVSEGMEDKDKKEEILELTDIVELGDKNSKNSSSVNNNSTETKDVLEKIDQVIGINTDQKNVPNIEQKTEKKLEKEDKLEKNDSKDNLVQNTNNRTEKILQGDESLNEELAPISAKEKTETNSISAQVLEATTSSLKALMNEDKKNLGSNSTIDDSLRSLISQLLKPYMTEWLNNNLASLIKDQKEFNSHIFTWLDSNLPSLVQEIVEREIKKITTKSTNN